MNNYSHNENLLKTVEEYNGEYEMSLEGLLTKEDGKGFHYFRLYDNTDELALSNNFISLGHILYLILIEHYIILLFVLLIGIYHLLIKI